MPLLRITVRNQQTRLHGAGGPVAPGLRSALLDEPGPVTLMIHGYRYHPGHPLHCPHGSILSLRPQPRTRRTVSWPERLGLCGQPGEGLGICFGWEARGSIWAAHRRAEAAGHGLACLVADIRRVAPARPVNVIAHSLGARVALTAIRHGAPGAISRAILLAAAEYGETGRRALDSTGGRRTQVLNVTTRENDIYDFLLECLVAPPRRGDRVLGSGTLRHPRLATLQLDDPRSLSALAGAGFRIAAPDRRICHWSPYLRDGVFALYVAFLNGEMPLGGLRDLLPEEGTPRWSRLRPRLPRPQPGMLPAE